MPELLDNINRLLDEAIKSENDLMNTYAKLTKAYEGLGNEKAVDVAGLKRPNFFTFILGGRERKEELENIKFAVEIQIKDNEERRKKEKKGEKRG